MSLKTTVKIALITLAAAALVSTITGFAIAKASSLTAASASSTTTAATSTTTTGTTITRAGGLPSGYQIVALPNKNVPNFQRRVVLCPSPKRVIGGGGEAQGRNAILVGSFPTQDGRGWIAIGRQTGHRTVGISVYAICAL